MKDYKGCEVKTGSWVEDPTGTYEIIWIRSDRELCKACRLIFDPSVENGVEPSSEIHTFSRETIEKMWCVQV